MWVINRANDAQMHNAWSCAEPTTQAERLAWLAHREAMKDVADHCGVVGRGMAIVDYQRRWVIYNVRSSFCIDSVVDNDKQSATRGSLHLQPHDHQFHRQRCTDTRMTLKVRLLWAACELGVLLFRLVLFCDDASCDKMTAVVLLA